MNQSFYIGAIGALGQQEKLNVAANNLANTNTVGYKNHSGVFSDLMYNQIKNASGADRAKGGSGSRLANVKTDFTPAAYHETGMMHDYAIAGEGFFMVKDPASGAISYTCDGRFSLSQSGETFYLITSDGKRVLNKNKEEIEAPYDPQRIGVYTFAILDGMQNSGNNSYLASANQGEPILREDAEVVKGALEQSGTDVALEMTRIIEAQRAYSYTLKMVQTSDEVEATINSLR